MKQKDIALLIIIAAVSAVLSFFISGKIFVTPDNRQQKVEVVDKIGTQFTPPDKKYFNENSVNPTRPVQQTDGSTNSNPNPFNGTPNQ